MAVASIIARPTNKVRVMVEEASGCWASEVIAVATALPSAKAGPMVPKPVVRPAITIDATAIMVRLSMVSPLYGFVRRLNRCLGFAWACGGRDVDRSQNAEDIGLHHPSEQTQRRHDDGKKEGCNG